MRLVSILAVVVSLALSGVAQAQPNGSITGAVTNASWTRGHAQFSATYADCGLDGAPGCFWSAAAYVIAGEDSCRRNDPFSIPTPTGFAWASDAQVSNNVAKGEVFFALPGVPDQRLCLYVYDRVTKSYWVGAADFTVGVLPPEPVPPIAATAVPAPVALTAKSARTAATNALAKKYAQAWRKGKGRKLTCRKPSARKVRCSVSFRYGKARYEGTLTVSGDSAHPKTTLSVKRTG